MHRRTTLSVFSAGCLATAAAAQTPRVIFSEIAASPTGVVPGALDAAGMPVATNWLAIEDLVVRQDGGQWCIKGRTTQATTLDSILILGSGITGVNFAQDGQPMQGGIPGEQYDFFDTPNPISWDTAGNIGLSFRAKGGVANTLEKLVRVVGGVHTQLLQQGALLTGLTDVPANPTGDETLGNSVGSVQLLDSGVHLFVNTPIGNCHSSRYPAMFQGNASFRQSGVSAIGTEIWDSFGLSDCGGTPDGAHWFATGDTENTNTAIDGIFVVDDVIQLQEGSPAAGTGPTVGTILFARMLPNGTWFVRGNVPSPGTDDWAVRNGVLLAKTGDPISGGENWGASFSGLHGDSSGNWVMTGTTSNPNLNLDEVLVLNGTTVLVREGDPVDLNGNGMFDDNVFIRSFQPDDLFLGDDGVLRFLVTLKDGAAVNLGDAFLDLQIGPDDGPYCAGDGVDPLVTTACPCANTGALGNGCASSFNAAGANITISGTAANDDVVLIGAGMQATGICVFLQGDAIDPVAFQFGDGVTCTGGTLIRLRGVALAGGTASFPVPPETITLSARGGVTVGSGAVRSYTVFYRNAAAAFCPPFTFNVGNSYRITW